MNVRNYFVTLIFLLFAMVTSAQDISRDTTDLRPVSLGNSHFRMAIKSNLVYDLAAIPNIGMELSMSRNWSVSANWMYAWWHNDSKHRYWNTYGGDFSIRKYFGGSSRKRSFSGHHLGLYGQRLTYDFERGGRGYQSEKWTWGGGLEYGYSFRMAKQLNLDLTLGVGCLMTEYMEYDPIDDCYVWQFTKKKNWIGPTKCEVSLIWLLWKKKGGKK